MQASRPATTPRRPTKYISARLMTTPLYCPLPEFPALSKQVIQPSHPPSSPNKRVAVLSSLCLPKSPPRKAVFDVSNHSIWGLSSHPPSQPVRPPRPCPLNIKPQATSQGDAGATTLFKVLPAVGVHPRSQKKGGGRRIDVLHNAASQEQVPARMRLERT